MDGKPIEGRDNASGKPGSEQQDGSGKLVGATLGTTGIVDPALAADTAGARVRNGRPALGNSPDQTPKRGRGRPAGTGAAKPAEAAKAGSVKEPAPKAVAVPIAQPRKVNINGVEKILLSIHTVMAAMAGEPEFNIEEEEAKRLSAAIAAVGEEYQIILDPKTAAWIELGKVCGTIYGPRAINIWMRQKAPAKVAAPQPTATRTAAPPPAHDPLRAYTFDPTKIEIPN